MTPSAKAVLLAFGIPPEQVAAVASVVSVMTYAERGDLESQLAAAVAREGVGRAEISSLRWQLEQAERRTA